MTADQFFAINHVPPTHDERVLMAQIYVITGRELGYEIPAWIFALALEGRPLPPWRWYHRLRARLRR
ncbi:hypothetical protein D9V32_02955 [Mycetocola tolaasinivorans]|uniref:Uncharacterized protein n=1 Tax=Mycetocola tolaasinivorans TaxID=76635 RepID=A0A3L7ACP1_9MICO|nr:hypothetical protein D9V32_02955 [Mycetocola tolaasinivorans]